MNICKICNGELSCNIKTTKCKSGFSANYTCRNCHTSYEKTYQIVSVKELDGTDDFITSSNNKCPKCKLSVHAAYFDELRVGASLSTQCIYCCKCETIWQQQFKYIAFSLPF